MCEVSGDVYRRIKVSCSEKKKGNKEFFLFWLQQSFSLELEEIYKKQTKPIFYANLLFCPWGQIKK